MMLVKDDSTKYQSIEKKFKANNTNFIIDNINALMKISLSSGIE